MLKEVIERITQSPDALALFMIRQCGAEFTADLPLTGPMFGSASSG